MQDRESRAGLWGKENNKNNIINQFLVALEFCYSMVLHTSGCTHKFWGNTGHMHGYSQNSCDQSGGHLWHLQRIRNERERVGVGVK